MLTPHTQVRLKRDFPRVGMKTGDMAEVVDKKGMGLDGQAAYLVTFVSPLTRKQADLVVLEEWVEPVK